MIANHSSYGNIIAFNLSIIIHVFVTVCVCVFYYCRTYYKAVRVGGRRVEDMCYERRRAEACVDESAHHALVNAGGREIV
jgi:hypothetical protein